MTKIENNISGGYQQPSIDYSARPINCDQVSWILTAIDRYLPQLNHPGVSRAREMQKFALLYEFMEVANLCFSDNRAKINGTPPDSQRFLKVDI